MQAVLAQGARWPGAIAVSGGGDSTALMALLADWTRAEARMPPVVLTVDHGLGPGSAGVAERVAKQAASLGLRSHILKWCGAKPVSNLEGAARDARYRLLGRWCRRQSIESLYVAHALEDQAETFLLRLGRGSGLDGLAAMSAVAPFPATGFESVSVVRPLLGVTRAQLREALAARGMSWHEDAMNADPRFARVRIRQAWPVLERLGLSPKRIADAAAHLARARVALEADVSALLSCISRELGKDGSVLLDGTALATAPEEIGLRALALLLTRVSRRAYRPRMEKLERLMQSVRGDATGRGRTLHGCFIGPAAKRERCFGARTLRITRENPRGRPREAVEGASDVKLG